VVKEDELITGSLIVRSTELLRVNSCRQVCPNLGPSAISDDESDRRIQFTFEFRLFQIREDLFAGSGTGFENLLY